MRKKMSSSKHIWQTQDAKSHFSEVIKKSIEEGDQIITLRGEEVAVIISIEKYAKLFKKGQSLLDLFRSSPLPEVDLDLKRSKEHPREIEL